jgi:hypothetical protein
MSSNNRSSATSAALFRISYQPARRLVLELLMLPSPDRVTAGNTIVTAFVAYGRGDMLAVR